MILTIPLAVSLFLYFLTRPYFFSAMINHIAGTVLGIYLIHDNNLMRTLIWDYIFPNLDYIHSSYYVLFYIGKVFAVFAICSIVELLRKRYVERPLTAAGRRSGGRRVLCGRGGDEGPHPPLCGPPSPGRRFWGIDMGRGVWYTIIR